MIVIRECYLTSERYDGYTALSLELDLRYILYYIAGFRVYLFIKKQRLLPGSTPPLHCLPSRDLVRTKFGGVGGTCLQQYQRVNLLVL